MAIAVKIGNSVSGFGLNVSPMGTPRIDLKLKKPTEEILALKNKKEKNQGGVEGTMRLTGMKREAETLAQHVLVFGNKGTHYSSLLEKVYDDKDT